MARKSESDASTATFNLRKLWDVAVNVIAALMTVYLILISIEPSRHFLEKYVGDISIELIAAIVAIMFEIAIITLSQLSRQVKAARLAVEARAPRTAILDVGEVMTELRDRLKDRPSRRKIDVLGLTLNTTWPQIGPILSVEDLPTDCELNLYCLDSGFVVESKDLPDSWSGESARLQQRITEFLDHEAERLIGHRIKVNLKSYCCVPIIHGFRYGDGTLCISFLQWREDGMIRPFAFYERIDPADTSQRADCYRTLFESWIRRVSH